MNHVVVIGGGISGLAAAHRARQLDPACELTLLEAAPRLGGVLQTVHRDGLLIEQSADNFITDVPHAVELCREVGLADQLISTQAAGRGAMVVSRGRLEKVPEGFALMAPARLGAVLTSPLLSVRGKLRVLAEYFVPRRDSDQEESLAQFARRRLGREAFERIVQPLAGGIYTADPEKLSLQATLPRFIEMERRHGGLIRGARQQTAAAQKTTGDVGADGGGVRYSLFAAPRDGMASLISAIAARLPAGSIRLGAAVQRIERDPAGNWRVQVAASAVARESQSHPIECDALVVAVPADRAAQFIVSFDPALAARLAEIEYAGTTIVSLAYRRQQIAHPLDAFGFVVPAIERRRILAGSFASVKFAGRAPHDTVLVRVFIGGACQGELADLADDEIRALAVAELAELIGARGQPIDCDIARWPRSMPQYHLGHLARVAEIERLAAGWPRIALAGNAYRGVGIPQCIASGRQAAETVMQAAKKGVGSRFLD